MTMTTPNYDDILNALDEEATELECEAETSADDGFPMPHYLKNARLLRQAMEIVRERQNDPMRNHKCKKIAEATNLAPGRHMWLGELLEPIPGHAEETHCLHVGTQYKSVVWGINEGDIQAYAILAYIKGGHHFNSTWIERRARAFRKNAEER